MSPFRKSGRPTWYVWPVLPGFGRVGPWSTGVRSKALAVSVEQWLKEIAMTDPAVVRGIVEGHYSLRDAYVAAKERRLETLKERTMDPPLRDVIARYEATVRDRRILNGIAQLGEMAPKGARLSWLLVPKHITDLLTTAVAEGRKVNSVHRSLYAAIKGLLTYEVGKARKAQITADVVFRHEDDSRDVDLTAEQLQLLLDASDPRLKPIIQTAVLTGIDLGPLAEMKAAHIDFDAGRVRVHDRKNKARHRTIELSDAALAVLRIQALGRGPDEPLWDLTYEQIPNYFVAARRRAGLTWLRFKDLRHVFATAWVKSGGSLKDLGKLLGHTRATTTLRYTARQASEAKQRMDTVAEQLGLARPHVKVEQGGGSA